MAEWEDPDLMFSHGHTKIITYNEIELKTSRKDLLQLNIKNNHNETGSMGGNMV